MAEQASRLKDEFIATLSHELQNAAERAHGMDLAAASYLARRPRRANERSTASSATRACRHS